MKWNRIVWFASLVLIACQTTMKGYHEYDVAAPFNQYRSFAWITEQPLAVTQTGIAMTEPRFSPIQEGYLREAVERNLTEKGYRKLDSPQNADLIVSFAIGAQDKVEVSSYPVMVGTRYGYSYGTIASDVRTYVEGTLSIDFFDRASKKAVWHGWVTKRLSRHTRDMNERRALIEEAVRAILEPFPAASGSTVP